VQRDGEYDAVFPHCEVTHMTAFAATPIQDAIGQQRTTVNFGPHQL
jgi:hypothetical protein